jgi:hypothetical protein
MVNDPDRTKTLVAWRKELEDQLDQLRRQQMELQDDISRKEAQLRNIDQLLESEGHPVAEYGGIDTGRGASLADRAFSVLKESGKPWYYRELAERLREIGVHISGNDRAANLLAHIGRDERFQRVKRGTYGLTEWKAKILDSKRRGKGGAKESPTSAENGK